jgi:hypothetical protein
VVVQRRRIEWAGYTPSAVGRIVVLAKGTCIVVALNCYGETERRAVRIVHVQRSVSAADAENLPDHLAVVLWVVRSAADFESCPACMDDLLAT